MTVLGRLSRQIRGHESSPNKPGVNGKVLLKHSLDYWRFTFIHIWPPSINVDN